MPGEVLWACGNPDLSVGSAMRLLLTFALSSTVSALAEGTTVDRDDVTRLGAVHNGQPSIGARRWPWLAGVNGIGTALISSTSLKTPRTATKNCSQESRHRRNVWVLIEKRGVGSGSP